MIHLIWQPSPPQRCEWPRLKACLSVNHPRMIHLRGSHCSAPHRRRLYLHRCHGRLSSDLNFVTVGESGFAEERAQEDRLVSCGDVLFFFFILLLSKCHCQTASKKKRGGFKSPVSDLFCSLFFVLGVTVWAESPSVSLAGTECC